MKLRNNDVWMFSNSSNLIDGKYRVIVTLEQIDVLLLFPLDDQRLTVKPIPLSVTTFFSNIKEGFASQSEYELPSYFSRDIADFPLNYVEKMERNYTCIKDLISDKEFLYNYATKIRTKELVLHSETVGRDRKEVCRLLTNYWRYGQSKLALIPKYALCGGVGKEKTFRDLSNGAPIKARTLAVDRREKYVVKDEDKKIFHKFISRYYLKNSRPSIIDVYDHMLDDYYSQEKMRARLENRPPCLPSYKQFLYFLKNNFSKNEIEQKRTSEQDFLKNKRGILGVATQNSALPGSVFEIDATVADVHIVSEFGSQYILGRPTIYIVIDRASRLIVGLHVSLYFASWRAARQALVNSFVSKQEFCRLYGIEIAEAEWPCADLPLELVCDNGEMIGLEPTAKVSPMTQLSFTTPYRPDAKGVVEKRFDILNKKSIHKLIGSTRGGNVVRGDRDPRKDAIMTLSELTRILILEVLAHNNSDFKELTYASTLLIENNLDPTPLNYWKIHVARFRNELRSCNPSDVVAQLLPPAKVSMTEYGLEYNGLYYTCPEIEDSKFHSIARTSGHWQLEARIDENTTNFIYVRLDKNKGFIRCRLAERRKLFRNLTMIEADFVQDWFDSKEEKTLADDRRKKVRQEISKINKDAANRKGMAQVTNFNQRKKGIRRNRNIEIERTTNVIDRTASMPTRELEVTVSPKYTNNVVPLPQGPKRNQKVKNDEI